MRIISIILILNITVIALFFLIFNVNFLITPQNKIHTTNKIEFKWIGFGNAIIDENPDFTSPLEIQKGKSAELKPGTYYWKAGLLSEKRVIVVDSEVAVAVTPSTLENETAYRIHNQGNTRILLSIIGRVTGYAVLEPDALTYEKNASQIEKISASQNE